MTFVDAHVPMYLVGAAHPRREDARRSVSELVRSGEPLVSSAEVVQEILHRYHALRRPEFIAPAIRILLKLTDEQVLPVHLADVLRAGELLVSQPGLSSRNAVHVAVMGHHGLTTILSFDRGFDRVPGIRRIP